MHTSIGNIYSKPTDYKLCKHCKAILWYEKDHCIHCSSTEFIEDIKSIEDRINNEVEYFTGIGHDIYNIEIDV